MIVCILSTVDGSAAVKKLNLKVRLSVSYVVNTIAGRKLVRTTNATITDSTHMLKRVFSIFSLSKNGLELTL
jgi:hypothetical protein